MSLLKGYKRVKAWGEGIPSYKLLTRRGYRSQHPISTLVHPHTRSARNTQLRGNTCLVCCFLWWSTVNQSSFSFNDICLLGWPLEECSHSRKIGSTRQQGPLSLISADRGLQMLIGLSPIIHAAVTYVKCFVTFPTQHEAMRHYRECRWDNKLVCPIFTQFLPQSHSYYSHVALCKGPNAS